MTEAWRTTYHWMRPALIRMGPSNPLMRGVTSLVMNPMCRAHGTCIDFHRDHVDIIKERRVLRIHAQHWIYALSLSANFDAYHQCVVPMTENGMEVVDYSRSRLQTFKLSGLEFEVASFPEEEQAILDYFRHYRPQAGETVFDLGANCGLSTYYLSKAVGPTGRVVAFEPDPVNHEVLLRNIIRHGLNNVTPLRQAIAAHTARLEFFSEGTIGSTLAHQSSRGTVGTTVRVEAVSLADACRTHGVPRFIKMDIEGAEIEVLDASQPFLKDNAIHFAIDTNHYKQGELTCHRVEALLRQCGYTAVSSADSGFWTTWAEKTGVKEAL